MAFTVDLNNSQCFLKDNLVGNTTSQDQVSGVNGRQPLWDACTGSLAPTLKCVEGGDGLGVAVQAFSPFTSCPCSTCSWF